MANTIDAIDAWVCHFPLPSPFAASWIPGLPSEACSCVVYRIRTSDGVEGCSAGIAVLNEAVGYTELLRLYLLGREVTAVSDIQKTLRSSAQVLGYRAWQLEPALWDAIGKIAGLPVYKLLGGGNDEVNAYASTGSLKAPEQHVDTVAQLVAEGFKAVKLRVRHGTLAQDAAVVNAVREAFGDLTLMVDANQGWLVHGLGPYPKWDLKRALQFAQVCEEASIEWLEEPLYQHDYDNYAALRASTSVRIAGGEMLADLHPFREHLTRGGLDIVQPDAILSGGILMSFKIAALAESFGATYAPHTWTTGVGLAVNLQCLGAASNAEWCEYPYEPGSWEPKARDAMLTSPITITGEGRLALPQTPGLGVEFDWEAIEANGARIP